MSVKDLLEKSIINSQLNLIDMIVLKYGNEQDITHEFLINKFIKNSNAIIVNDQIQKKRGRPKKNINTNISDDNQDTPAKIILKVKK